MSTSINVSLLISTRAVFPTTSSTLAGEIPVPGLLKVIKSAVIMSPFLISFVKTIERLYARFADDSHINGCLFFIPLS